MGLASCVRITSPSAAGSDHKYKKIKGLWAKRTLLGEIIKKWKKLKCGVYGPFLQIRVCTHYILCKCLTNIHDLGIIVCVQAYMSTTTVINDNSPIPLLIEEETPQPTPTATADPPQPLVANFPDSAPTSRCSENVCGNGHGWMPEIQVAQCAGCRAPIILVRMVNCPVCNEPCTKLRFRSDHLPSGGVVTPVCRGSASLAEVTSVEIARTHSTQEEMGHKKRDLPKKV